MFFCFVFLLIRHFLTYLCIAAIFYSRVYPYSICSAELGLTSATAPCKGHQGWKTPLLTPSLVAYFYHSGGCVSSGYVRSQFKTEIQFVSGFFLTGAERVFAIFIWTPEGPQAQWGDSKHPSGNIQLRACSLGPLPSHAQGDWGDFSHFDWADSKDLWSCWTPRWGKVANKTKRICFWDYFNLYKVMRPCVCFFLSNQTALPWSHGVVGVGGTLKMILFVLPPFGN